MLDKRMEEVGVRYAMSAEVSDQSGDKTCAAHGWTNASQCTSTHCLPCLRLVHTRDGGLALNHPPLRWMDRSVIFKFACLDLDGLFFLAEN